MMLVFHNRHSLSCKKSSLSSWSQRFKDTTEFKAKSKPERDGPNPQGDDEDEAIKLSAIRQQRNISECYFAVKGAALVLPQNECVRAYDRKGSSANGGDIQQHLQSMFYLLRPEDTLKMAVKLESIHSGRTRYLVVVSCMGKQNTEESTLLGVDCNERTTIGLVQPVWVDTQITLDGDGGFSVSSSGKHHIFKPVSVQAMWSALQTLHKASGKAREYNYFMGGLTHSWIEYYEKKIQSDRSCLNEWNAMDNLESRRPYSPDCFRSCPKEREITEKDIKVKLREIMMTVDLDEVTSKYIRTKLEEDLDMDLHEYKSFIDHEMITILGQMDAATEIFDYLYLGSEWNASNLEELQKNGVGHILNVTREIDNFFPGMFNYLNIRVYDDEGTELLKHWDTTYKFITSAKEKGSKVLVHCKMGVSRSASVVIAYAMKARSWNMQTALQFVKNRRNCIKPNHGFMKQLEIYQGILGASKHRHNTLWRSKSENNLKMQQDERQDLDLSLPEEPLVQEILHLETPSHCHRPKSWSPDDNTAEMLFPEATPGSVPDASAGDPILPTAGSTPMPKSKNHVLLPCSNGKAYSVSPNKALHLPLPSQKPVTEPAVKFQVGDDELMSPIYECKNVAYGGCTDDASQDTVGGSTSDEILSQIGSVPRVSSIKDRINELESQAQMAEQRLIAGPHRDRLDLPENTGLVLNLANQFESSSATKSNPASPVEEQEELPMMATITVMSTTTTTPPVFQSPIDSPEIHDNEPVVSQTKPAALRHQAVLIRPETWSEDPNLASETAGDQKPVAGNVLAADADPSVGDGCESTEGCGSSGTVLDEVATRLRSSSQSRQIPCPPLSKEGSARVVNCNAFPVPSQPAVKQPSPAAADFFPGPPPRPSVVTSPVGRSSSSASVFRQNDPFSVHLDRVFDREERTQQRHQQQGGLILDVGEVQRAGTNLPARHDSWGSCDSAIGLMQGPPPPRQSPSRQSSWGSVESRPSTGGDTAIGQLSREGSWGSADRSFFVEPGTAVPTSHGVDGDAILLPIDGESDRALKRTSSFDGALPTNTDGDRCGGSSGGVIRGHGRIDDQEFPPGNTIQRSQSLRTNPATSSSYKCPAFAALGFVGGPSKGEGSGLVKRISANIKLHGPKPYKSPNLSPKSPADVSGASVDLTTSSGLPFGDERRLVATKDTSSCSAAGGIISGGCETLHYASTPILYQSEGMPSPGDGGGPLHSASQPNITCTPPNHVLLRSRPLPFKEGGGALLGGGHRGVLCVGRGHPVILDGLSSSPLSLSSSAAAVPSRPMVSNSPGAMDQVPSSSSSSSSGIVRQHKEILENIIASLPNRSNTTSAVSLSCTAPLVQAVQPDRKFIGSTEELRKGQHRLQESVEDGAPSGPGSGGSGGTVRRITREMEAKGVVPTGAITTAVGVSPSVDDGQENDRVVIVEQFSKGLTNEAENGGPPDICPAVPASDGHILLMTSDLGTVVQPSSCSLVESVKSLVGKFEVKDKQQAVLRHRYFSESEASAGSHPWSPPSGSGSPAPTPPSAAAATTYAVLRSASCCVQFPRKASSLDSAPGTGDSLNTSKLKPLLPPTTTTTSSLAPSARSVAPSLQNRHSMPPSMAEATTTGWSSSIGGFLGRHGISRNRPPPAAGLKGGHVVDGLNNGSSGTSHQQLSPLHFAQRKLRKAQGKSHPLSRLPCKPRHVSSLYNTM